MPFVNESILDILENSADVFVIYDSEYKYIYANTVVCELLGKNKSQIIGRSSSEILESGSNLEIDQYLEKCFSRKTTIHFEYEVKLPLGKKIIFDTYLKYFEKEGKSYALAQARDITHLKAQTFLSEKTNQKIIKEIDRQKILFETVLNHNPDSLIFTNPSNDILLVNEAFVEQFGYKKSEILGVSEKILFAAEESFYHTQKYKSEKKNQSLSPYNANYITKDKNIFTAITISTAVYGKNDQFEGYLSVIRDITEEVRIKEKLKKEQVKSIHLDRLRQIGEFSGLIAHEINSPLEVINSSSEVLLRKTKRGNFDQEKFLTIVERIQTTAKRIAAIVASMREFYRIEKKEYSLFSIRTIIDEIYIFIVDKAKKSRIEFEIEWNGNENLSVLCDPIQIGQIIVNLINNSIHAIEDLSEKWIKVRVLRENKDLIIEVVDSGKGIEKKVQKQLMEAFFTTKESGKGTGLGLNISSEIASNHDGSLSYCDKYENTCFVLNLPLAKEHILKKAV